jgi:hypothetical protein
MAPSLIEVFKRDYSQDDVADLDDMSYARLKIKSGVMYGLHDLSEKFILLDKVGTNSTIHRGTVEDLPFLQVTFSNTADIYE